MARKSGSRDINLIISVDDKGTPVVKKAAKEIVQSLDQVEKGAKKTGAGLDKMKDKVAASEGGWKRLGNAFKGPILSMAAGMGIMTGVQQVINKITQTIKSTIDEGLKFEKAWDNIRAMVDQSDETMDKYRIGLMKLSPIYGSSIESANAFRKALQLGFNPEESFKMVPISAKLAEVAMTDVATAMQSVSTVLNAYGQGVEKATSVSDTLFKMVKLNGRISFAELEGSIGKVAPLASQAGISLDTIAAAMVSMTKKGIEASAAAMQLRMFLVGVLNASKDAKAYATSLGLEFSVEAIRTKGLAGFIQDLTEKTGGSLEKIDKLGFSARVISGVMMLAAQGVGGLNDSLNEFGKSAGMEASFKKKMASFDAWITVAKSLVEKVKIGFMQGITGAVEKTFGTVANFEKKISEIGVALVDWGLNAGATFFKFIDGTGKIVKQLVAMKEVIKDIIQLYVVWYMWQKRTLAVEAFAALTRGIGNAGAAMSLIFAGQGIRGKLTNFATLFTKTLGNPIVGLGGALKALPAVGMAAFAGWKIGRVIGEVTGLDKMLQDLFEPKAKDRTGGLAAGHDAVEALRIKVLGAASLMAGKNIDSIGDAMAVLRPEFEKTGSLGNTVLDVWAKKIGWVLKGAKDLTSTVKDGKKSPVPALSEEELKAADELTKRIGVTTKDELGTKLKESEGYLRDFKKQLTTNQEKALTESIRALRIELGLFDGTLADLGVKTVPQVKTEMDELEKKFAKLRQGHKDGTVDEKQYSIGVEEIETRLKALSSTAVVASDGIKLMGRDFNATLPAAKDLGDVLANMPKLDKEQFDVSWFPGMFNSAKEAADVLGVTLKSSVSKNLVDMELAYDALKQSAKDQGVESLLTKEDEYDTVVRLIEIYKKLGKEVPPEYAKIIAAGKILAKSTQADMSKAFGTIATALQVLGDSVSERFSGLVTISASIAEKVSAAFTKGAEEKLPTDWAALAKDIGPVMAGQLGASIAKAITGRTGAFAGVGAALGGALGQSMQKGVTKSLGKMLGKTLGDTLGAAVPIVGSLIGGLIGGLFGGKSKEQKAADKLKKDIASMQKSYKAFGDISENLAKQLVELKNTIGATRAEAQLLSQVMQETGITTKNFSTYVQKISLILGAMKSGALSATEGMKALNDSLATFITGMVDMGREGDKTFVNLIKKFRTMGVSIKAVDDYVYGWLSRASAGLTKMTMAIAPGIEGLHDMEMQLADLIAQQKKLAPSSGDYKDIGKEVIELNKKIQIVKDGSVDAKRQIDNVSASILATFNAYIAQGKSWYEAMTELSEPLANLSMKLEALGMTGNDAITKLLKISDFAKANKELFEAIDGNREVMEALGNTGFLTAETLKATTDQAAIYYKKLTDAGLDSHDALALMAPSLADAVYYAKQLGIPLDDATQALIDQAKAAGVYKEKARSLEDVLKEGFDNMVDRMDRLIDRFGRAFPDAINRGFDVLDQRAADSAEYLDNLNPDATVPGGRGVPQTGAATGFHGTVTGPRMFYVEPGIKERVDIGAPKTQAPQVTVVERTDVFEPIVLPLHELETLVIKWVKKANAGERLPIAGRSIRG